MVMRFLVCLLPALLLAAAQPPRPIAPATFVDWHAGAAASALGMTAVSAPQRCPAGDVGDDCVVPGARVSAPGHGTVLLTTAAGVQPKLGIGPLVAGGPAAVVLQAYTRGAHCCESVRVAAPVPGGWRIVDLGQWNGGEIAFPRDVSGDGVADFAVQDDDFYYAFGCYACTSAPPKFLNVVDGRRIDVSARPGFAAAYERDLARNRAGCIGQIQGNNGPCATYAADAARLGRFAAAWREILAHYDRKDTWDLPTGCRVARKADGDCPTEAKIVYRTYPQALRAFLTAHGYLPPRARGS